MYSKLIFSFLLFIKIDCNQLNERLKFILLETFDPEGLLSKASNSKLEINFDMIFLQTPLQLAIIYDVQSEIVKTLLDYRADIKEVDGEGNNILHLAAKFQRHEALGIILVHKAFDECAYCIDDYNFEGC